MEDIFQLLMLTKSLEQLLLMMLDHTQHQGHILEIQEQNQNQDRVPSQDHNRVLSQDQNQDRNRVLSQDQNQDRNRVLSQDQNQDHNHVRQSVTMSLYTQKLLTLVCKQFLFHTKLLIIKVQRTLLLKYLLLHQHVHKVATVELTSA
jgi:hypothetical protein